MPALTGYAPPATIQANNYLNMKPEDIIQQMYRTGLTQDGVNAVYQLRGVANPPTLPPNLVGATRQATKGGAFFSGPQGRVNGGNPFLHTFNSQVVDPFREYTVGNYLGMAGLLAGGAAALGPSGAGVWGGGGGAGATGSGLGVFSNGGAAGLAGVGGGNAGALAASGAIAGGAGAGAGTGILGTLAGTAGGAAGGGSMGWWDTVLDLLPAVGSLYNSGQQRDAAKDAVNAEQAGIREGIAENRRQFDTTLEMLRPQRELGNSAIGVLNRLGGYNTGAGGAAGTPDMSAFTASPDYNFRRDEGTRDINNSFAARGGALSGNALRGITDFNSNLASGEFNNFVQRRLQEAGLGGAATSQAVSSGNYTSGNVSNLLQAGGNARASGIVNASNATTSGLNDLGGWYGNWLKNRRAGGG